MCLADSKPGLPSFVIYWQSESNSASCNVMDNNYRCKSIVVGGDKLSPVLHLSLAEPNTNQDDEEVLNEVAKYCIEQGVAVVTAKYLTDEMTTHPSRYNIGVIIPVIYATMCHSLRLTVCSEVTEEEITKAAGIIIEALDNHL